MNSLRAWALPIAVAAAVLVSTGARGDEAVGPGFAVRTRVAILPLVVNSVGEQGYLRTGLADMLASRLGRSPEIAVLRIEDPKAATTDAMRAVALGVEHDADFVVFGSFTQFGQGASLDVQCVEARLAEKPEDLGARRIFIQSGTVGEIIPKLDETAGKIAIFLAAPAGNGARTPAVAAAPEAPTAAPDAAASSDGEVADLRRRVEALEAYLFGGASDRVADQEPAEGASQELRLR